MAGSLLVAPRNHAISQRLAEQLQEVERLFAAELHSDLPCVNTLVDHIEQYRGKMLRPMLVLVTGMACSPDRLELTDAHRTVAGVVEMVHMATLVHDDVLDEADVRRGGTTINHLRGNETAVMLGDYLISHAYHLCSSLDVPAVSRIIADATNRVCEGEMHQLANRNNWNLDEQTYYQIIGGKTAYLCGTCCRLGALLGDADDAVVAAMDAYGQKLGLAFQIIDDLLDLTGDEHTVGKTLGLDLQKGKLTLPLIHLLAASDVAQRDSLHTLLDRIVAQTALDDDAVRDIRRRIVAGGSVEYANGVARRLVGEAKQGLAALVDSPARSVLDEMADAVLTRKF